MMNSTKPEKTVQNSPLKLRDEEIIQIENAMQQAAPFGEVRLVIDHGRLRWLIVQQSLDMLKLVNKDNQ